MRLKKGHLFCHLLLAPRRIGLVELFPLCDHLYNVVIFGIFYVPSVRTESTLPRVVDCVSTSFSVDVDGLASMNRAVNGAAALRPKTSPKRGKAALKRFRIS